MSVDAVYREVVDFATKLVVITGGEPFLQWNDGLQQLEELLINQNCLVQYETSGKIAIPEQVKGFSVCSPKFLNSQWVFDEINLERSNVFKFVADNNFATIKEFTEQHTLPPEQVYIMPKGVNQQEQLDKFQDIWTFCLENSFHFSPRLHVLTFNNKRGV